MLSEQEVKIYRLCHHDFEGLPVTKVADRMGLSPRRIQQILAGIEAKAPQLFPILTRTQAHAYSLRVDSGLTLKQIAFLTGRTRAAVAKSIRAAVEKGMPAPGKWKKHKQYQPDMDARIVRKF